jgi:glycosyltransferase involved in cell wall biosynthesis
VEKIKYDVVIPVYNGEATLGETINSVLAQSYKPERIIVIDDLSSDNSARIASSLGAEVHQNTSKLYSAGSRNRGLSLSTALWVATIDADDLWNPDAISQLIQAVEFNPEIEVIGGLLNAFGAGSTEPYNRRNLENLNKDLVQKLEFGDLLLGSPLAASACLFRKDTLSRVGGWPMPTFAEDYHLIVECYNAGAQIYRLNSSIGSYRLSAGQKSSFVGLQTDSQLIALRGLFWKSENSWSHEKAVFHVWLSYLARLQNASMPFLRKDLPPQFLESKSSVFYKIQSVLLENRFAWKTLGAIFKTYKRLRTRKRLCP